MSISHEDQLHGAVILKLVDSISTHSKSLSINLEKGKSSSLYTLNIIENQSAKKISIGIYIKISKKRISPWRYTFDRIHQSEIMDLALSTDELFIVFVAGLDGFAALSYNELKKLLDDNFDDTEWVSVSRKIRQSYRVDGKDSNKKIVLPKNVFPTKVLDYLKKSL